MRACVRACCGLASVLPACQDYLDPEIERQESNSNEAEEKKKKDAAEILGTELEDIWSSDDEEAADEAKAAISRIRGADGRINTDMQVCYAWSIFFCILCGAAAAAVCS